MNGPLSDETKRRVSLLFSGTDLHEDADLLVSECGANLPFFEKMNSEQLDELTGYASLAAGFVVEGIAG